MIDTGHVAFFVTGMGRSGTKWLARLLAGTPSDVRVMHEPLGYALDVKWMGRVYRNPALGSEWAWFRRRKMGTAQTGGRLWGEVSSWTRYAAHDLRVEFPGVPIAALVRDGRFVVRSMLARGTYSKNIPPVPTPAWAETPFLKCAWYWADTYRLLVSWQVPVYRLEDLNDSYASVEVLCEKLGVEPPPWKRWAEMRHKPANETKALLGKRLDWSPEEVEAFRRAAGDMQRKFGYPLFIKNLPTDAPPKKVEGTMGVAA
jgi:hypothetical protein